MYSPLGLFQAFADALKLLLKEYVAPTQANLVLFFLGPVITLVFALLVYAVIPYAPGISVSDFSLGILYLLAVGALGTYGILLAGFYFPSICLILILKTIYCIHPYVLRKARSYQDFS
jgi:NADH:ubiquinone oxidoreductase subunit H